MWEKRGGSERGCVRKDKEGAGMWVKEKESGTGAEGIEEGEE